MTDTHLTAPTRFVKTDGDRFGYGRRGSPSATLKFKFLLWMMPMLLQRAIKTKPACARYVSGKRLEFQIQTRDKVGRSFRIQDGQVKSYAGLSPAPKFTLTFKNADRGFKILAAKDGKEAFLAALHDEDLAISGDFVEVLWFQGFTEYLQTGK